MPVQRITKRVVDGLSATTADIFIWDSDVSGFGIRVSAKGHKSYVIRYRMPGLGRRGVVPCLECGSKDADKIVTTHAEHCIQLRKRVRRSADYTVGSRSYANRASDRGPALPGRGFRDRPEPPESHRAL